MEFFIKASQFIASLSILIVLHELGHFIPAKFFKTRVEKFYLFFDYKFSIFKKKIGLTEYGIGWIPLGGYVKISGMIDESMDTDQMSKPVKPWEFRAKPAWQRLIIMLGGVTVNFIFAFAIYTMILFVWGQDFIKSEDIKNGYSVHEIFQNYGFENGDKILEINGKEPKNLLELNKQLFLRDIKTIKVLHKDGQSEFIHLPESIAIEMWTKNVMRPFVPRFSFSIDSVLPNSPADIAGIKKGDILKKINEKKIIFWDEANYAIKNSEGSLNIKIDRNGQNIEVLATPNENNKIGIYPKRDSEFIKINHKKFSLIESVHDGYSLAYWTLKDYISQFKYVFTKKGSESIGGFIAIGNIFPKKWSWQDFWSITAFLSIILGFMNLLPIPALDGGHVAFTLYEIFTGRKPSDKFLEYAQIIGFVILMALLLFANVNDVVKLFK